MATSQARRLSKSTGIRVQDHECILVHVILEMVQKNHKQRGRSKNCSSIRAYRLIVKSDGTGLLDQKWKDVRNFPLNGMKMVLVSTGHQLILDNLDKITRALKKLRGELQKSEADLAKSRNVTA